MAGKGDKPRNCFTRNFKENFDSIDWTKKPDKNGFVQPDTTIGNKAKIGDVQKNTNNYQSFYNR
jgi:hypothetical protein